MRGTGIDSDVDIYAMKQSNEHLRTETDPVSETSCLFFFL
jgi:hypothetical protein